MTSRNAFVVAALVTCGVVASAQAPAPKTGPSSEIFLASFEEGARRTTRIALLVISRRGVEVGKPVNITKHPGDDNQSVLSAGLERRRLLVRRRSTTDQGNYVFRKT